MNGSNNSFMYSPKKSKTGCIFIITTLSFCIKHCNISTTLVAKTFPAPLFKLNISYT